MIGGDRDQSPISEQIIPYLGEGAPGFDPDTICLEELRAAQLLVERMGLDLVDRGFYPRVDHKIHHAIIREVADADRANLPFPMQLLHRPPRAENIAVGLMDEVQIQVLEAQFLEGSPERFSGQFITDILNPGLVQEFVKWYNTEHRHSAINFVTPVAPHAGQEHQILARRKEMYEQAKKSNPARWSGATRNWQPVGEVSLNPASRKYKQAAEPQRQTA